MALQACRECDSQISTEADACPNCGCPEPVEEAQDHAERLASYDLGTSGDGGYSGNHVVCRNCGTRGKPERVKPGSFLIEFILWFLAIIPGVIYSVWRLANRIEVCSECESDSVIPPDSPLAQQLQTGSR